MSKPSLTKERRAWLASLRGGKEVASVDSDGGWPRVGIVHIDRPGADFRHYDGRTYTRNTGRSERRRFGSDCEERFLIPATDELRLTVAVATWRGRLFRHDTIKGLSDDQIAAIAKVLGWSP